MNRLSELAMATSARTEKCFITTDAKIKSAKITIAELDEIVQASQEYMDTNMVEVATAEVMRQDVMRLRTAVELLKEAYL